MFSNISISNEEEIISISYEQYAILLWDVHLLQSSPPPDSYVIYRCFLCVCVGFGASKYCSLGCGHLFLRYLFLSKCVSLDFFFFLSLVPCFTPVLMPSPRRFVFRSNSGLWSLMKFGSSRFLNGDEEESVGISLNWFLMDVGIKTLARLIEILVVIVALVHLPLCPHHPAKSRKTAAEN